jgi:hypothetical protein
MGGNNKITDITSLMIFVTLIKDFIIKKAFYFVQLKRQ